MSPREQAEPVGMPASLLLLGAGKMGGALLSGWLTLGLPGERIVVIDPNASETSFDHARRSGVTFNPREASTKAFDTVVLAVKPQMLAEAGQGIMGLVGPATLLVSIVAGKTIADLRALFPLSGAFARVMPNTPAAIGRGVSGVFADPGISTSQKAMLDHLMRAVGTVEWLSDEALIDAVTAVSGSGPAYVFFLTECLAKAGEQIGLPADAAMRLARATVEGAGALLAHEPSTSPDELRRNVTSPGGTTAAALAVLMENDRLPKLMTDTVKAAQARARSLAG